MPIEEYANSPSFDSGTIKMKKVLLKLNESVNTFEDLRSFLGLEFFDIEFNKDVYNKPTRGRYYFVSSHVNNLD